MSSLCGGLLSPISYALQRGIYYVGIIPCLGIGRPSLQRRVVFEMVLFTASCGNNFVGGKCAPPSALLVASQLQGGARFRREKFFVIMRLLTTLLLYTRNFSALNWKLTNNWSKNGRGCSNSRNHLEKSWNDVLVNRKFGPPHAKPVVTNFVRRGYLPKIVSRSIQGFFLPICVKLHIPVSRLLFRFCDARLC